MQGACFWCGNGVSRTGGVHGISDNIADEDELPSIASISNIVIILSSWAVIKVPMLANEAKFLGVNFMIIRWVLTVIAIFVMAYITGTIVKKKDLPVDSKKAATLEIKEDYCIGCGLCVKLLPEYYEMNRNKAVVTKMPEGKEAILALKESVEKCPSKAIILNKEEIAS